jgi:hypothetical protein
MRNIEQYPITVQECINHINYYGQKDLNSGMIGGTGPYVTSLVCDFLDQNRTEFEEFLQNRALAKILSKKVNHE